MQGHSKKHDTGTEAAKTIPRSGVEHGGQGQRPTIGAGQRGVSLSVVPPPTSGPAETDYAFRYYRPLQRVKDYVDQHYANDIPLRDAAQVARLEERYFSAYFRAKTGIRWRDWLAGERITRAQEMMTRRDYSITEVAFAVGYHDLRTFQRAFKKCAGMTPRDFKKTVRP